MKGLKVIIISVAIVIIGVGCKKVNEPIKSIVIANTLNVRENGFKANNVIAQIKKGDTVEVLGVNHSNTFAKITYNGNKAYVSAEHIKPIQDNKKRITDLFSSIELEDWTYVLIVLLMVSWPLILLINFLLKKYSPTNHTQPFMFTEPDKIPLDFFRRIYIRGLNIVFWGSEPSSFLRYWVFSGIFIITLPLLVLAFSMIHQVGNPYTVQYEVLGYLIQGPLLAMATLLFIPLFIFLFHSTIYIFKEVSFNRVAVMLISLLLAYPILIITLILVSILLALAFLQLFVWLISPLFSSSSAITRMNGGSNYKDAYQEE